jgi:hypothetical protein
MPYSTLSQYKADADTSLTAMHLEQALTMPLANFSISVLIAN